MKLAFYLLVTLSIYSAFGQSAADWNAYKRANGIDPRWTYNQWVAAGMPRGNGGNNNGGGFSPEQIAEQQREQAARQQDKQGLDAFNQGDYDTATNDFQKALKTLPNDATIQKHLTDAQQAQADAQKAKEKAVADKAAHDAEVVRQFEKAKAEGLSEMKGIDFDGSGQDTGLKGLNDNDASGLKGLDDTTRSSNAITANDADRLKSLSDVNNDPMVVDARNVPTGLPKEVEDSIPKTPAGDRVRKGFEAIQNHDWKVALAWFQDALNHEPGDPGLQRLVDLAQFTLERESQSTSSSIDAPDGKVTGDAKQTNQSFNNTYQSFLEKHPDIAAKLKQDMSDWDKEDPAWIQFFRKITAMLTKPDPYKKPDALGIRG